MKAARIVFAGDGFVIDRHGVYRILVLADSREGAAAALQLTMDRFNGYYQPSRHPLELAAFGPSAELGDIKVSPRGRKEFEDAELDDIEP